MESHYPKVSCWENERKEKTLTRYKTINLRNEKTAIFGGFFKSDRRGSNPRSQPWQGCALPATPLSHICFSDNEYSIVFHHFCQQIFLFI